MALRHVVLPVLWMTSCFHATDIWGVMHIPKQREHNSLSYCIDSRQILLTDNDRQLYISHLAKSAVYDCLVRLCDVPVYLQEVDVVPCISEAAVDRRSFFSVACVWEKDRSVKNSIIFDMHHLYTRRRRGGNCQAGHSKRSATSVLRSSAYSPSDIVRRAADAAIRGYLSQKRDFLHRIDLDN